MKLLIAIGCVLLSSVLAAKEEITCEFDAITLECKGSKVIQMETAFWGRDEIAVCTEQAVPGGGCDIGNALSRLSNMCNGKQTCTVEADNKNFGDPCFGTLKYMKTSFKCVNGGSVNVCEDFSDTISCPGNSLIQIGNAFYGRETEDICDKVGVPWPFGCTMGDAKQKAENACNGQSECTIESNNAFFGDPCWGVRKYATVSWICPKFNTFIVCQGSTKELACPDGKKLKIKSASYGRADSEICHHVGVPAAGCHAKSSKSIVKAACHKENSCTLESSDAVFGDPCWGTPKYLSVQYMCK